VEGVFTKKLAVYEDSRGWLTEIFRTDETEFRPAMSYVSITKPGVARGPHEHLHQSDYFCFFGNFRLYLWDNRRESPTYGEKMVLDTGGAPYVAIVPPRVVHAYRNIGSADALVVNLPDRLFKGEKKAFPIDEVRHEDDPASPFVLD
jgi:dTDP-4-dehydrorhamnose 3,5-epimerase